jgi:peptide/nickel transport system substrate-binding protein
LREKRGWQIVLTKVGLFMRPEENRGELLVKRIRFWPIGVCVVVASVVLPAVPSVAASSRSASGHSKTLTIAASQALASLDPDGIGGLGYWPLLINYGNVSEGLVGLNGESATVLPVLATSWKWVTSTTLEFHLRPNVKFQDGSPFNAQAVIANVNRVRNPKTGADTLGYFEAITGVKAVSSVVVDLTTKSPDPILVRELSALMILSPKTISGANATKASLGNNVVGTGPYELVSVTPEQVTMKAFPGYWGQQPSFSHVNVLPLPDVSTRMAALSTSAVQIAYDVPIALAKQAPKIVAVPGPDIVDWRINAIGGITKDPRVREGINLAVNRTKIVKALLGVYGKPDYGQPVAPGVFGFNPAVKAPPYNPTKAHSLFKEAGVLGKTIDLITSERFAESNEYAEAAAQEIDAAGLNVKVVIDDETTWLNVMVNTKPSAPAMLLIGPGSELRDAGIALAATAIPASGISEFPYSVYPLFLKYFNASTTQLNDSKRGADLRLAIAQWNKANAYLYGYQDVLVWGAQKNISWFPRSDNELTFSTVHYSS